MPDFLSKTLVARSTRYQGLTSVMRSAAFEPDAEIQAFQVPPRPPASAAPAHRLSAPATPVAPAPSIFRFPLNVLLVSKTRFAFGTMGGPASAPASPPPLSMPASTGGAASAC